MPAFPRVRDLDTRAWRTATLSAPFAVQLVLGLLLVAMWALGKGPFTTESGHSERAMMIAAAGVAALVSLLFSAVLLTSPSARNRGLSLSIAGSAVVVLIGGAFYAYLILR